MRNVLSIVGSILGGLIGRGRNVPGAAAARNLLKFEKGEPHAQRLRKIAAWVLLLILTGSGSVELLAPDAQGAQGGRSNFTIPHSHTALWDGGVLDIGSADDPTDGSFYVGVPIAECTMTAELFTNTIGKDGGTMGEIVDSTGSACTVDGHEVRSIRLGPLSFVGSGNGLLGGDYDYPISDQPASDELQIGLEDDVGGVAGDSDWFSVAIETEGDVLILQSADAAAIDDNSTNKVWDYDTSALNCGSGSLPDCWLPNTDYSVTFRDSSGTTIGDNITTGDLVANSIQTGGVSIIDMAVCAWDATLTATFCEGATFADGGTGVPTITHNFGTTDYSCMCTVQGGSSDRYTCTHNNTSPPAANTVTFDIWDNASSRIDRPGHALCFAVDTTP